MPNKKCKMKCNKMVTFKFDKNERCMIESGDECMNFNYKICMLEKEILILKKQLRKTNKKK